MCGIVGFIGGPPLARGGHARPLLERMATAIRSRGPDDAGYWEEPGHGVALGHRRLAVVDLSAAGHQPMVSADGRYVLVFNGEIYNHQALRHELDARGAGNWRGHSDTETLLAGFVAWGIQATLERAVGMFALALWDRTQARLTLARDRVGEKPLYYGWQGQGADTAFLFGSELKALRVHPGFAGRVNRGAVSLLLRHSYIPAPHTVYEGMYKLAPGTMLTVGADAATSVLRTYWSALEVAQQGARAPFAGTPEEAVDKLELLLSDAIGQQMMADVPLGAFLSGGVDSSAVVALMQAQSARPIQTFTIGFHEAAFNEAGHARAVAAHLGTAHTELYVTAQQALDVVPGLPAMYDEPFADSSQIPTFLVSQLARRHVTVALSGDGGDELFCGYNRYQMTARLWGKIQGIPMPLRKMAAGAIGAVAPRHWDRLAGLLAPLLPPAARMAHPGDRLHKGAGVLQSRSVDELYLGLVSHQANPAAMMHDAAELPTLLNGPAAHLPGLDSVQRMMALDMVTYLPDDILVKVDRAAMAVSLEGRVPLLDHRVIEFAATLPQSLKLREGQSKWALRQVLYRHVPRTLIERPKMGFGVPLGAWLRGPLRAWAEALLDEARLRNEGFFDVGAVRRLWQEHQSSVRDWQYQLWDVLMFQAWLEQQ